MPFTLSHAAVAGPLARRGLVLSALIVGSMAPDFEYYLRLSLMSRWGHTLPGVFSFCLPCALAALWLFHRVLKWPLLGWLPPAHRALLEPHAGPFAFGPPRRFVRVAASVLVGILTHLLFDAFTHVHGVFVDRLPALQAPLLRLPWGVVPVYEGLQYAATAVLSLALLAQYARWYRRAAGPGARWVDALALPALLPRLVRLGVAAGVEALV